jgi:Asp-tRNA(Asn)/Glu-tRNA(Gln) amidotransferase A subunit family amidase
MKAVYLRLFGARTLQGFQVYERRFGQPAAEDEVESSTVSFMDFGRNVTAVDYLQDLEHVNAFTRQFAGWWSSGFDLLLSPSITVLPPKLGTLGSDPQRRADLHWSAFVRFFNFSGQPSLVLERRGTSDRHSTRCGRRARGFADQRCGPA